MDNDALIFWVLLLVTIALGIMWNRDEQFYTTSGDFHVEVPGTIADEGSFSNDMRSYMDRVSF